MLAPHSISWARPSTWPWFIYVWFAFALSGFAKPVWSWFQRMRAAEWPATQGRIDFVYVKSKRSSIISSRPRGSTKLFAGELDYSYSVEGQSYSGHYEREFGFEAEAQEFVRELQGKSVSVSYNPRNAAKSTLTNDAVTTLLNVKSPLPEGTELELGLSEIPAWTKPLLWPLIALSVIGLALSLWVHIGALAGRKVAPESFFWMLHIGIFVVWLPAVLIAQTRIGSLQRRDMWKVLLTGAPEWVRFMVYAFGCYAIVNFLIFMFQAPPNGTQGHPPAAVWRGFSGHWMAFYSAALAIFYSAVVSPKPTLEPPRRS